MHPIPQLLALGAILAQPLGAMAQPADSVKPTIVLVHGAFAESASWNAVITRLAAKGYRAIAAANPLRGVVSDAASVGAAISAIDGPVVLVGHSYGGPVITEAANGHPNVKALVYVAGFLPEPGESSLTLSSKFPGSTLAAALVPANLPQGETDLYIDPAKFHAQFAADVPDEQADLMAFTQRPVAQAALAEPSGTASWKVLPTYVIYGSRDLNIPPDVLHFMADRAKAVKTVVIDGASHAVMVSHPDEVADLIADAALAQ
ncbi:alpha/beta hydrolase [Paracoccus sp. CPCC 101403]|uniref:Alpha/beta hydrolase n=2 Tax=Paracoccus broussonetiae TaxID=3075834 RepID=A0ABU3EJU3_9RHOB|nr:alpha/beta hydrolase [Paracoccus sp. CPCC 101403]